jgi:hypothetical protein
VHCVTHLPSLPLPCLPTRSIEKQMLGPMFLRGVTEANTPAEHAFTNAAAARESLVGQLTPSRECSATSLILCNLEPQLGNYRASTGQSIAAPPSVPCCPWAPIGDPIPCSPGRRHWLWLHQGSPLQS